MRNPAGQIGVEGSVLDMRAFNNLNNTISKKWSHDGQISTGMSIRQI